MRDLFGEPPARPAAGGSVTLTLTAHDSTGIAYRMSLSGDDQHSVWLPRGALRLDPPDHPPIKGRRYRTDVPRGLAAAKGLI